MDLHALQDILQCSTIHFVESSNVTRDLPEYLSDEEYRRLPLQLVRNPTMGAVMPGCGGLRKQRLRDVRRGKGRRGGLRIIYLFIPEITWILLLDIYAKDEREDLSASQKKQLAQIATRLKQQARQRGGARQ